MYESDDIIKYLVTKYGEHKDILFGKFCINHFHSTCRMLIDDGKEG